MIRYAGQFKYCYAENERQQTAFEAEVEKVNFEAQCRIAEVERNFADALEVCCISYTKDLDYKLFFFFKYCYAECCILID